MKGCQLSDNDLKLISGEFFDLDLPKEKQYLFKYFPTEIQKQFLRYYYVFGEIDGFMDHTGWFCTKRWLRELTARYNKLVSVFDTAKQNADFTTIAEIQSGKFKI